MTKQHADQPECFLEGLAFKSGRELEKPGECTMSATKSYDEAGSFDWPDADDNGRFV